MSDKSAVRSGDHIRLSFSGIRTRKVRALLSGLGIAIGIASMVAVLGISQSSQAALLSKLDALGTNMLSVTASSGFGFGGGDAKLTDYAEANARRIAGVTQVASVADVSGVNVYRNEFIAADQTNGISVKATDPTLLSTLSGTVREGRFLDDTSDVTTSVVLGSVAAERLGLHHVDPTTTVKIGDHYFGVVGILNTVDLATDLDRAVLISRTMAEQLYGDIDTASVLYVRTDQAALSDVREAMPSVVNVENPDQVTVTRPSDAIAARAAAKKAFTSLFLGLGVVAVVVGGIGVANVMVISVLERRREIGLRRAIGATRRHIATQFLGEALVLAILGGIAGVAIGAVITTGYAINRGWTVSIPLSMMAAGVGVSALIGAVAGVYPAQRGARLAPAEALRSA